MGEAQTAIKVYYHGENYDTAQRAHVSPKNAYVCMPVVTLGVTEQLKGH